MRIRSFFVALFVVPLAAPMLAAPARAGAPELAGVDVAGWARQQLPASLAVNGRSARVEIEVGQLDPRLRLAPCVRIEPYRPPGSRPWGRTHVGLRCVEGASRWNVYLPVTVRVLTTAPVLIEPRPAGHELRHGDLRPAEVDWAAEADAPVVDLALLAGRRLARPVAAGAPVRADDLQQRHWFEAGDTVRVIARGRGYAVSAEAQALSRGVDGRSVRLRTAAGRVIHATAVADRTAEMGL